MNIRIIKLVLLSWLMLLGMPTKATGQEEPSTYVGSWAGELSLGTQTLEIGFDFALAGEGLSAVMHSPDQGAFDIPAEVTLSASGVTVSIAGAGVSFLGTLTSRDTIDGTLSQRGNDIPLTLRRQAAAEQEASNRPQTPKPPFDYVSENIRFTGGADDVVLAGTLTKPRGAGPFPAVIAITGSGPQDRDETIFEHKPFLVIADHLTEAGFAVLRYDDRGIAESTGDFRSASSADFADDASAAISFLTSREDIDSDSITLLGHSEGGLIAPLTTRDNRNVSGLILLAPPIADMEEVARTQIRLQGEANGLTEEEIERRLGQAAQMEQAVRGTHTLEEARAQARRMIEEADIDEARRERGLRNVERSISPWIYFMWTYDPSDTLKVVDVPILALFAEKDVSVEPIRNQEIFERIKTQLDRKNWDSEIFAGLNHLFQTANTGAQSEYGEITETISPAVLRRIEAWLTERQTSG